MTQLSATYLRQARTFLRTGENDRAIELLETAKVLARDDVPLLIDILIVLGPAYEASGAVENAQRCAEQLHRLNPQSRSNEHTNNNFSYSAMSSGWFGTWRRRTMGAIVALLFICAVAAGWLKWHSQLATRSSYPTTENSANSSSQSSNINAVTEPTPAFPSAPSDSSAITESQVRDCVALLVLLGDYEGDVDGMHYKMEVPLGNGTAFVVKRSGVLLTAKHVTHAAKENEFPASLTDLHLPTMTLRTVRYVLCFGQNPNDWSDASLIYESDKFDLAVLKTDRHFATALDCTGRDVAQGEDVYVLGFPGALVGVFNSQFADQPRIKQATEELKQTQAVNLLDGFNPECFKASLTRGIISVAERNIGGAAFTQSDAKVSPGNSGGPLLDSAHRVVGIVTMAGKDDASGYNFALLTNQLQDEIAPYMTGD